MFVGLGLKSFYFGGSVKKKFLSSSFVLETNKVSRKKQLFVAEGKMMMIFESIRFIHKKKTYFATKLYVFRYSHRFCLKLCDGIILSNESAITRNFYNLISFNNITVVFIRSSSNGFFGCLYF